MKLVNTAQLTSCALVRYAHSLAEKMGLFRLVKMTEMYEIGMIMIISFG
jgi:hypothetical protein